MMTPYIVQMLDQDGWRTASPPAGLSEQDALALLDDLAADGLYDGLRILEEVNDINSGQSVFTLRHSRGMSGTGLEPQAELDFDAEPELEPELEPEPEPNFEGHREAKAPIYVSPFLGDDVGELRAERDGAEWSPQPSSKPNLIQPHEVKKEGAHPALLAGLVSGGLTALVVVGIWFWQGQVKTEPQSPQSGTASVKAEPVPIDAWPALPALPETKQEQLVHPDARSATAKIQPPTIVDPWSEGVPTPPALGGDENFGPDVMTLPPSPSGGGIAPLQMTEMGELPPNLPQTTDLKPFLPPPTPPPPLSNGASSSGISNGEIPSLNALPPPPVNLPKGGTISPPASGDPLPPIGDTEATVVKARKPALVPRELSPLLPPKPSRRTTLSLPPPPPPMAKTATSFPPPVPPVKPLVIAAMNPTPVRKSAPVVRRAVAPSPPPPQPLPVVEEDLNVSYGNLLVEPSFEDSNAVLYMLSQLKEELTLRTATDPSLRDRAKVCAASIKAVKAMKGGAYSSLEGKRHWNRCARAYLQF